MEFCYAVGRIFEAALHVYAQITKVFVVQRYHSISRFVLLVFQPHRIAQYFWILTVKSLKLLGVCGGQSFDCVLPFASA